MRRKGVEQFARHFRFAPCGEPGNDEHRGFFRHGDVVAAGPQLFDRFRDARVGEMPGIQPAAFLAGWNDAQARDARLLVILQRPAGQRAAGREPAGHDVERHPGGEVGDGRPRPIVHQARQDVRENSSPPGDPRFRASARHGIGVLRAGGQRLGELKRRVAWVDAGRALRLGLRLSTFGHDDDDDVLGPGAGVEPAPSRSRAERSPLNYPGISIATIVAFATS
jgi:hypothetical protein